MESISVGVDTDGDGCEQQATALDGMANQLAAGWAAASKRQRYFSTTDKHQHQQDTEAQLEA